MSKQRRQRLSHMRDASIYINGSLHCAALERECMARMKRNVVRKRLREDKAALDYLVRLAKLA